MSLTPNRFHLNESCGTKGRRIAVGWQDASDTRDPRFILQSEEPRAQHFCTAAGEFPQSHAPPRRNDKKKKSKDGFKAIEVSNATREAALDQRVKKKSDRFHLNSTPFLYQSPVPSPQSPVHCPQSSSVV